MRRRAGLRWRWAVPPMLLGFPRDNTYLNYCEANLAFWRMSVLPCALRMQAHGSRLMEALLKREVTGAENAKHVVSVAGIGGGAQV